MNQGSMNQPTPRQWIIGENCDLILAHDNHEPVPLIAAPARFDPTGPRVRIHHEVYYSAGANETPRKIRHLWFRVLIAERMLAPDGSFFSLSADDLRRRLNAVLKETGGLRLTTRAGTIAGLYGKDHVVIQSVFAEAETFEIHLSTRTINDVPLQARDTWLADPFNAVSTWGAAVWR